MSKGKDQHVVPHEGKWAVVGAGNTRATVVTETQQASVDRATLIATHQRSEVLIHNRTGQIRERSSHGHDPHSRKG
jgi:hypothetical protein